MANESNLIPVTQLSREDAKALSSKGGIARAKQKKEKKTLKTMILAGLEVLQEQALKNETDPEKIKLIKATDPILFEVLNILQKSTDKNKLNSAELLLDRLHGKPKDIIAPPKINIQVNVIDEKLKKIYTRTEVEENEEYNSST